MAGQPVRLKLKIQDVIDGEDRFPESRDEGSKVFKKKFVNEINRGQSALPWGCPYIVDLTAIDAAGDELSADDILAQKLEMKSVFVETMPDGSVREQHGPAHDGAKYNSCLGMGTRFPKHDDLGGQKVKVEAQLAGLSAAIEFAVS